MADPAGNSHPYPRDAREALEAPFPSVALLSAISAFARAFGLWRRPARSDGRFENMTLIDKIRYMHKARYPVMREEPGTGVEALLAQRRPAPLRLPDGFVAADRLAIHAVGDLIPHALLPGTGAAHFGEFGDTLFGADLVIANLEAPVVGERPQALRFRASRAPPLAMTRDQFDVLTGNGARRFTVLSTACNHSMDFGMDGLVTTLDTVREAGIHAVGTDPYDAAAGGLCLDVAGFRIGIAAATFGLNGMPVPPDRPGCVNVVPFTRMQGGIDLSLFERQFAALRGRGCDMLIASVHWGREYEFFPAARQLELGHRLVELGAGIVLGHHPHNIQPVEMLARAGDAGPAVICHSLGNLTSPLAAPYLVTSLMVRIGLVRGTLAGRRATMVESVDPIPVFQDCVPGEDGPRTRLLRLAAALRDGTASQARAAGEGADYADLVLGRNWRAAP